MNLSASRKWLMAHPVLSLSATLLVLLMGYGLWRLIFVGDDEDILYTEETIIRGDIENLVTATGILQPQDYVDVGAQVSGQLKKLHVEVGSEVKAGDLLAEIDATVYAAKVDATRAQLRNQKAQLLDREAQLQLAEINYQRQKNLQQEDATTEEALQTAEANLKSARAQLNSLQAQIQQTESTLRVEAANLDYARIYSPMDGTVVSITSRQGQTLNTNQMAPTIMRVADLTTMTVQTQVSEADIGKLKKGMDVYFTTLGSQGRRWYGKLDRIQPTPEILNNVILYNALFEVPNDNRELMTQMSAQVFFIEAEAKDALLAPLSALTFGSGSGKHFRDTKKNSAERKVTTATESANPRKDIAKSGASSVEPNRHKQRQARVKIFNEDGKIEEREVTVGVANRVQAQIIEGLREGEKVISGSSRPSQAIRVAPGGWGGMRR